MNKTDKRIITGVILIVIIWAFLMLLTIQFARGQTVENIKLPHNYVRVPVKLNSFGEYLRGQELKSENVLRYYNGRIVPDQDQFAVLKININGDHKQRCTDVIQRFRAEYLLQQEREDEISFSYRSDGKQRTFINSGLSFNKYMSNVYLYSNSGSLNKDMKQKNILHVDIGDVFLEPDNHTVIVVDKAINMYGEIIILIAEGSTPAVDVCILKNYEDEELSPWFKANTNIRFNCFTYKNLKTW